MDSVYDKLTATQSIRTAFCAVAFAMPAFVGCVDGPLYELKKLNPIYQRQWKEDRDRGPVGQRRKAPVATRRVRSIVGWK